MKELRLNWTDENNNVGEMQLEPYQVLAISQILGLEIKKTGENYQLLYFDKDTVFKRLSKMGILVKP